MLVEHSRYSKNPLIYFEMVKMVNLMLYEFYPNINQLISFSFFQFSSCSHHDSIITIKFWKAIIITIANIVGAYSE